MAAPSLRELLASGKLHRSLGGQTTRAAWNLGSLAGRVVELTARGPAARLAVAACLLQEAQLGREPTAWIGAPDAGFFPPDLAAAGVDLDALAVVHTPRIPAMLRAADTLLRSGAFGLIVLDLESAAEPARVALAAQTRLVALALEHRTALLCLQRSGQRATTDLGSFASLRAEASLRRVDTGRFASRLTVVKDKRSGPGWEHVQVFRAPPGMA